MIEHNVYVVVADGRRAQIYRNSGTAQAPHLDLVTGFEQKNPASHEHGSDKGGSVFSSAGGTRSRVGESDYHDAQERLFAKDVMHAVVELDRTSRLTALIWIAPPRMLASLRADMPKHLKEITKNEIDKDLTKHSAHDILSAITA